MIESAAPETETIRYRRRLQYLAVAFFAFGFDVDVVFFSGAWMRIVSIMGIFEFALHQQNLVPKF